MELSIVGTEITIKEGSKHTDLLTYAKGFKVHRDRKVATTARNTVLSYFSDFISKSGGLSQASATGKFSKPTARPDQEGSLTQFLKVYGIEFQSTSVREGAEAYNEIKQKTSETGRATTLTSRTLARSSISEASFLKEFQLVRKEKVEKEETFGGLQINKLSSPELHKWINTQPELKAEVLQAITEKFENFTVIDYLDLAHDDRPRVRVLPNAANMLKLVNNFQNSVTLTAREVKNTSKTGTTVSIRLEFKLSESAYEEFLKIATDATNTFHQALGKNVNTRFITYAASRFATSSKHSKEFLIELFSFAKEFEFGTNTPITYRTVINKLPLATETTDIIFKKDKPKKENKETKITFISDIQLTALVQRETERRMPKGPFIGPPLSETILTYRTGSFVNSIRVIQDFRNQLITYYYAPNYKVHERRGGRAPRLLLQASIREVVKKIYAERFRIIRGF